MFRNTWRASVETELSNAPAAWTCDSTETPSHAETSLLDSSANQTCIPHTWSVAALEGSPQRAPGVIFFCHCLRVTALLENKSVERRFAGEGVHLMSDLPEL